MSDSEHAEDHLDAGKAIVDAPVKAAKKPISDRTKSTLFIRNLPFTATNEEFTSFFSEFGPTKSSFIVMEHREKRNDQEEDADGANEEKEAGKNKGFGFVQYATEGDALRAIESLKTTKFQGRKLKAELAMRKHVKLDTEIMAAELPKVQQKKAAAVAAGKKARPEGPRPSSKLEISFSRIEGHAPIDFNKKHLYKKVRKVAQLNDLVYPHDGDSAKAMAIFSSVDEALRAMKKLDKHIFKGVKMGVTMIPGTGSTGEGIKAHRLIVRNLPFKISPAVLDEHFGAYGVVREIVLPTKPGSTALRGFAFVQFEEREAAVLAMAGTNGKELAGRMVAVDWAVGKTLYEQISKSEKTVEESSQSADADESEAVEEDDKDEDEGEGEDADEEDIGGSTKQEDNADARTVFVRNIAFESSEAALSGKFSRFGPIEYCKLVVNPQTGASRGTAFVRFKSAGSANAAVKAASLLGQDSVIPLEKKEDAAALEELRLKRAGKAFKSMLVDNDEAGEGENEMGILLDGRALSVVPAVDRDRAASLKLVETEARTDKRRLGLIKESELRPATPAATKFWSPADIKEREAAVKARLTDLKRNANSVISEVRLSVRHLPTAVTEEHLKSIFEHVLQEAKSHAETVLADNPAHQANATRATPRLKQVKIVRSTGEDKESRAGRSKGFGFVELTQPSHALLALRYATNYIPDVWHRILPEIFGRRLKHGTKAAKDVVVLAKGKPIVPVIEFAIDKVAVLEKSGKAAQPKKQQIHKANKPRTASKRPAGSKQQSKPKRQKK